MTTLTAPAPRALPSFTDEQPIHLFQLGVLFVIRVSYWSCRAGNEPQDFDLSPGEIESRAIASLGSKELIDPEQGRRAFQQIEKKARHQLARFSRPFAAANAHFVPWDHVPALIASLEALKAEFDAAAQGFIEQYPLLRSLWQGAHPEVPDAAYPGVASLRRKFSFCWHSFRVAGAGQAMEIDDIEAELAGRQIRTEQLEQLKLSLQAECQQFAADYVIAFRQEVAAFCDQVIEASGKVHGKTLQSIRRKIEHFAAMNVFGDADAEAQLKELKTHIFGVSGEDLAEKPALAAKLSQACAALKQEILDPDGVSALTGRLKRRVVLD